MKPGKSEQRHYVKIFRRQRKKPSLGSFFLAAPYLRQRALQNYQFNLKPPIQSSVGDTRVPKRETQTKKENKTSRLTIRFTETERSRVRNEAGLSGLTAAAFARKRILGARVASKADLAVLAELRRLGGLLKHVHNETRGAYSSLTAQAIRDLSDYVRALAGKRQNNSGSEADS
jgi:hypothetical protein